MQKYRIYRHPENISLNGKEFICDDDGDVMLFTSAGLAMVWLQKQDPTLKTRIENLFDNYGIGIELDCPENGYYDFEDNDPKAV